MLEREMEDLIAGHPDYFFPRHGFVLQGRQQSFQGVGRFDLLFRDRHGMNVLMELKAVPARYDAVDQVARYRDLLLGQGTKNILMWVVAPAIPPTMREMLSHLGIEFTEISEHEFKRAAKSFGYVLRDPSTEEPRPDVLAPVCLDGKWGFIDIAGKFVIPATFANIGRFSEGLASASIDGGMLGYIDKTGRFVIEPRFDEAGEFSEGSAIARILDEEREEFEWGCVDRKTLKYIRWDWCENYQDIRYEDVLDIERNKAEMSEGLRPVCDGWLYGYQNDGGRWEIEPQFEMAGRFSDGLAVVRVKNRYGVIDRELNFVLEPQYDLMQDYKEGLSAVRINSKWGFIDRAGRHVIEPQFDSVGWGCFDQGVTSVEVNGMFGIVDRSGRFTLKPRFARIDRFYCGLAAVEDSNGKWGFIDKQGNIAIAIRFDGTKGFHFV
jgi:hypothetical protein